MTLKEQYNKEAGENSTCLNNMSILNWYKRYIAWLEGKLYSLMGIPQCEFKKGDVVLVWDDDPSKKKVRLFHSYHPNMTCKYHVCQRVDGLHKRNEPIGYVNCEKVDGGNVLNKEGVEK
jgi:hypothetical protein